MQAIPTARVRLNIAGSSVRKTSQSRAVQPATPVPSRSSSSQPVAQPRLTSVAPEDSSTQTWRSSSRGLLASAGVVGLSALLVHADPAMAKTLPPDASLWEQYQNLPGELRGACEVVIFRFIVGWAVTKKWKKNLEEMKQVCDDKGLDYQDLFVQPGESKPARFGEFGRWAPTPEGEPKASYGKAVTIMKNRLAIAEISEMCAEKNIDISDVTEEAYPGDHKMSVELRKRATDNGLEWTKYANDWWNIL